MSGHFPKFFPFLVFSQDSLPRKTVHTLTCIRLTLTQLKTGLLADLTSVLDEMLYFIISNNLYVCPDINILTLVILYLFQESKNT